MKEVSYTFPCLATTGSSVSLEFAGLCVPDYWFLCSWSPFSTLMVTLFCTHGHPSLHSSSPFSALMVTLLCTHGHHSLHSWSPFSALMVTLLCTHGHPSLHSWSPFSALMVTLLCTHGHPSLHSWSPLHASICVSIVVGEGGVQVHVHQPCNSQFKSDLTYVPYTLLYFSAV